MHYRFGDFILDVNSCELRTSGGSVAIRPQQRDLLWVLLEAWPELVSNDTLKHKIWPGQQLVEPNALDQLVKSVRVLLGDNPEKPTYIHTKLKVGRRMMRPVSKESARAPTTVGALNPTPGPVGQADDAVQELEVANYAIFVHYILDKSKEEYTIHNDHVKVHPQRIEERLQTEALYLREVLEHPGCPKGFAFLFVDIGWLDLLRRAPPKLRDRINGVKLGGELHALSSRLKPPSCMRVVTIRDLSDLLETLSTDTPDANDLTPFLLGDGARLQYDSPKVMEAVLRIANIGRQVPIFRFDDDVIFAGVRRGGTEAARAQSQVDLRRNIKLLYDHYWRLTRNPAVNYFVFSGGYMSPEQEAVLHGAADGRPSQDDLLDGLSTRLLLLTKVAPPSGPFELNVDAACEFIRELWHVGANPLRQVVSGAGLCLSDGAILDLPPFSCLRENVVWIDDHLKYALHHELRHFGYLQHSPHHARVEDAWFSQRRYPDGVKRRDIEFMLSDYSLRLLRGVIADAWLRADPRIKRQLSTLSRQEFKGVMESVPGHYAKALQQALRHRQPKPDARQELRSHLWKLAVVRLRQAVRLWSLPVYDGTFLELVIKGPASAPGFEEWAQFLPPALARGLTRSVDDLEPQALDAPAGLGPLLSEAIADFERYIEWVCAWGQFTQSVRGLLNWTPQEVEESQTDAFFWVVPGRWHVPPPELVASI